MLKEVKNEALSFPKGVFFLVNMTTQTSAPMDVTIEDENGAQLFHGSRTGTDPLPVISGTFTSLSGKARIIIRCETATNLDVLSEHLDIKKADGGLIMREYVYVAEDSTDADYNDLYVSIVDWQHKG
ncbi:MAG: fucose-binding lectin II [Leuconostoc pseudomesenteroides]|uniref:fucose-binding lectin II n=1 Tax=Leuconostoc pseudomesenteroides TaxID=33968 RepID=UPI0039E79045